MTSVYLHIGLPKTGTTAIQYFFCVNEEAFLRQGVLYPKAGRPGRFYGHHHLVWEINHDKRLEPSERGHWNALYQEIGLKRPQTVVISSEAFVEDFRLKEIEEVHRRLSGFTVRVIIYLRRQDEWIESIYKQVVAADGDRRCIQELIDPILETRGADYYALVKCWEKFFGEGNITVRFYDRQKIGDGLIDDFLKALNIAIDIKQMEKAGRLNVSLDSKTIKAVLLFNRLSVWLPRKWQEKIRQLYIRPAAARKRLDGLSKNIPDWIISPELLSRQERERIMSTFEASNQRIAQEYGTVGTGRDLSL
ncbi:MAG TPA: hypothetical protein VLJ10_04160, partial [Candidatus Bathyarchaeia archaeon]|nr:hypothetical protein [Candidatus Bathyarchaeia archaeon]